LGPDGAIASAPPESLARRILGRDPSTLPVKPERCTDSIVVLVSSQSTSGNPTGSSEMTVETILATKGTDVTTIEPTATLEFGIGILAERGIGALVVLGADHRVIGLLSERDIVRALAERGASVLTQPLARVMTRTESTCTLSEPVDSIMEQMTAGKVRHVPVVEQERLVGIVSIGDVVKHRLTEMERESEALHDYIQKA
jgi:CBS domain-containing protein